MKKAFLLIDCVLLSWTVRAITACIEWLSVSQRALERTLVRATYLMLLLRDCSAFHHLWAAVFAILADTLIFFGMRFESKRPDVMRLWKLATWTNFRLATVALAIIFAPIYIFGAPHRWSDWPAALWFIFYAIFHYSTSLPIDGERGKKREEATEQMKDWLRSLTWLPQPEGV